MSEFAVTLNRRCSNLIFEDSQLNCAETTEQLSWALCSALFGFVCIGGSWICIRIMYFLSYLLYMQNSVLYLPLLWVPCYVKSTNSMCCKIKTSTLLSYFPHLCLTKPCFYYEKIALTINTQCQLSLEFFQTFLHATFVEVKRL